MHRRKQGGKFVLSKLKKMEVQETIAFIGGAGKNCPVLMKKMAQGNLRLLFLYNEEEKVQDFVEQLKEGQNEAEIEVVNCVKESCWEADIIAFVDPGAIEEELLRKIKEVATQKILLLITTEHKDNTSSFVCRISDLEKELPFSKIVSVKVDSRGMKAELSAKDPEALETVAEVMGKAGYEAVYKNS